MSFNYNNEVLDLLLKKTLGSSYTSSDLVSGQETPVLPKIQNSQIFTNRITDKNSSNFTWSSSSNVTGGGTVKYLDVVTGETATFQYIKKYEAIPMSVVAGTDNRAWKPTASGMQEKFQNVILGKPNFSFSITTDITNYETIYSTNSGYKPVINNGILVFLGNSVPSSTTVISMKEVFVYEGAFGTTTGMLITDMANVTITSPQDGQALVYDNATQKWIAGTVGGDYIPISTLETLDDVSLNNLAVGQTIGYDGFKWIPKNVPIDLSDISDVNLSGATDGQAIVYDDASGNWKPGNVQTPLIQLSDISDVKFDDGPYDGQGLVWKDVSSCWIAKDIQTPLNSLDDVSGVDLSGIVAGQTIVLDISGVFVPKNVGEVIENLSDLKDVDVSNLADQIPQWTQKNRLEASDAAVSDNFGFASALDISYALVGAPNANSNTAADVGKAYLYLKNFFLGTYSEEQVLMSTINSGNMNFGYSVTISQTNLIIGAPNHSYDPGGGFKEKAGTVFFYNYNSVQEKWGVVNGSYYNENSKIQPGVANNQFGYSIDIDVSGVWCIIGSPQQLSNGNGKANIYENVSGTWTHRKALTASDGAAGDNFGVSVRINDEKTFAFVGADNHDSAKGAVYVFKKNHPNANDWGQYQKIVSLDQRINSYFGKSIGVNGNSLLIGSPNSGNFSGAVYEVTYSTGTGKWGTASGDDHLPSSDKIVALDASANDQYGYSVDVYDNFGVVGSKSTDMSGNVDTGSAYIIINTGEGYWEESKQVNPGDLDVQDEYGISVGIYGRSIVIGSWLSEGDQGGDPAHAGSAYIFNLPNPEGGTKALIYDTDYNRWKVGSVAPSDEAVVTKLGLLEDVDVTTIANNNVLAYDDASGNWTATTMGSLLTIGDISDVDLSGVATGNAIIWDASLNKWIVGDAGGGSASGVTSTNIQPTGEDVTAGQLYYDSSWNSFHGRTTEGWKEIMLSNTNLLFGSAPIPKKQPGEDPLLVVFPDRYEFSWENPPQYSTGFSASNGSDYVNGDLYLPVINHIKFEFFETADNETWGSTSRGTVTIGGKSGIGRGSINGNTTQTLSNISGVNKITNKLILYSTGSGAAVGVSDGWTNLNTASGASYEYDFVDIDASGNQAYYFNPRSSNFSIDAQTPYSFRMWLENSVTPHTYRIWGSITTQVVGSPTKIKIADVGQTNGFYATIIRESSGVHKIKVVVPSTALTAAGVEVTSSETGIDDSVFFEAYEVQYQTVNAQTNENTETSAITGWSGTGNDNWTGEESVEQIFDEGSAGLDHYSCIPATTPLQNKSNITVDVSKNITIPQFNNKFYRFRVRAKNQVGTDFGPWTTDYYVVRFTRPQQMAWNTSSPPLFLTKTAHPDKWFITLTWQDTKSSNGGVSTGDDDWQHTNLGVAEFKLTRTTDNGSNYSVADNENGDLTQSSAKLTYDYIVASSTDATQKWSNPSYKFKIQARNYLFGTSSNDAGAWSTISTATVSLIPTTPVTPTLLQIKFYEQNQTNGTNPASYYTADPWTAPTFDYLLYQWDVSFNTTGSGYGTGDYTGVTIGAANKLTPEQYQLEFFVGKGTISGSAVKLAPEDDQNSFVNYENTELIVGSKYKVGTDTAIYTVGNLSGSQNYINGYTGSLTGVQDIYGVLYINATNKNLPGANPYFTRDYNKEEYTSSPSGVTSIVRNGSFSFTVKAKNYFVSTASSGFVEPGGGGVTGSQTQKLTLTGGVSYDSFGNDVSIDGNYAIIGASGRDNTAGDNKGSAYIYNITTGTQLHELTADDAAVDDYFGMSVGIDGNYVIVGAPYNDDDGTKSGSAYIFSFTDTTKTQRHKLTASDGAANDLFGNSVGISGYNVIVGAYKDHLTGTDEGSAYLFSFTNTTLTQEYKLTASDAASGDNFGDSVAISGNYAIVGASTNDDGGTSSGSAYIFNVSTGGQLHKLIASDDAYNDRFGYYVDIDGNYAIVGAYNKDSSKGAAYIFNVSTGAQLQKVTASDGAAGDNFGQSVGIDGNYAVVGARGDDGVASNEGSAYIFNVSTGAQLQKITASDPEQSDSLGKGIAISGNYIIVGAVYEGSDKGAVYVFQLSPTPAGYDITSPSAVRYTSTPTIDIQNDKIVIKVDEPEKVSKALYDSTPTLFNTKDAIDYNLFSFHPYINNVSQAVRNVYTTDTSATQRVITYDHLRSSNSSALNSMTEANATIKYDLVGENILNTSSGDLTTFNFKLTKPAPTNMDAIPLFEWVSDGTNNIKLTLRRSNGGLVPSSGPGVASTICPITNISAHGNQMQSTADELYWQVKSSVAISGGITADWSNFGGGGSWINTNCVIGNIGTLTEDQEYEIFFRLKNRYIADYLESTSPKIKLTKPNAPDWTTALLDIVDDNETSNSGLNTFSFTWVKPTQPGLHYQHDGAADNAALTAHPTQPYIEKYKIYVTDSTNSINYSFYVTGGSTSVECPVTVTIVGEVDNIGGGKFVILPDIAYNNVRISAYNVRLTTEGNISNTKTVSYVTSGRTRNGTLTNNNYGVPYTIVDQDREYDNSYKTSITLGGDYTYGNQAALANGNGNVSGTVKNWNTITTTTTTNFGPVLLNARKNKPGNNPIMSWYVQVGASDPGPAVTRLTNGTLTTTSSYGYLKGVNAVDVFGDTHSNSDQWYKTNIMYFEINRTEMLADTAGYGLSGSPITIKFGIKYYDQNSSTTSWGADITACTSQYFGTCNVVTDISGTPTVSYTPYKITGIPTLYPGKTQTIIPSYIIDNDSNLYMNNDYIAKITLDDGTFSTFMPAAKRTGYPHFTTGNWPPSVWISKAAQNTFDGSDIAATSTSNIIQSKIVKLKIDHKNLFGDGTTHIMKVSGTSNDYYFIYDITTYNLIDASTTNGMSYTHLLMNYNGSAAHQQNTTSWSGYRALTPVNPPNAKFNPATEISNLHISGSSYTSTSDWTYGTFTGATDATSATCNGLAIYNGKYQSPAYLKSTNTYGLAANANNYPLLSTWYSNYSTTVSSDNVWANSNNYRDNYRWGFWKFKAQNGTYAGVQPVESQIYLANGNNDNNTNINFSDLTSTEADGSGTSANVKICIKTYYISGSTPKVSSWNQVVSGNSATSPGNLNATQLTSSTYVPATGNGNSGNLSWTGSTSSKNIIDYSELGSAIPTDSTWKSEHRPLPFLHGASTLLTSTAMWHIIAVGIKNNSAKYIGNIYIGPKYDAAV